MNNCIGKIGIESKLQKNNSLNEFVCSLIINNSKNIAIVDFELYDILLKVGIKKIH